MNYNNYSKKCFFSMSIAAVVALFSTTSVLKANVSNELSSQLFQVAASQYLEILNIIAYVEQDASGLYDANVSSFITQLKTCNGCSYSVIPGQEDAFITLSNENKKVLDDLSNQLASVRLADRG